MAIKDTGMHKPKRLPRCPSCNSKNTVGRVRSADINKRGSFVVCNCYFCSNCLTEWSDDGIVKKSLYV